MFYAIYTIKRFHNSPAVEGWARYEDENEMYADLEVQGIVEDNPAVEHLEFFHTITENGKTYIDNTWM